MTNRYGLFPNCPFLMRRFKKMNNRVKKIIWIDDSISRMKGVVVQLIPELWVKGVSCKLVFLGDHYKTNSSLLSITEDDIKVLQDDLDDRFYIFCDDQYEEKKNSGLQSESGITLEQVYDDNSALQPLEPCDLNEESGDIPSIVAKIAEIAKGCDAYIGLDIQINLRDEKIDKITQAMRLFHDLCECENDDKSLLKVFLYSSDEYLDDWKDRWFTKLKDLDGDFNPVLKKIFKRNRLLDNNLKPNREKEEFYKFLGIGSDNEGEDDERSHS
jgi:hypothetical protein